MEGVALSISWVMVCVTWSSTWVDYQRKNCLGWRRRDLTMCFLGNTIGNTIYFTDIWKSVLSGPCLCTTVCVTHEAGALLVSLVSALRLGLSLDSLGSGTTVFCVCLAHGDSSPVLPLTDNSALWHQRYLVIDFIILQPHRDLVLVSFLKFIYF